MFSNKIISGRGVVTVETLEGREMFSATHVTTVTATKAVAPGKAAVVMGLHKTEATATKTKVVVTKKPVVKAVHSTIANVVGKWEATFKLDAPGSVAVAGSIDFVKQKEASATGDFDFGSLFGGKKFRSTAVVGKDRSVRVMINADGSNVGITATISSNGEMIYGRFSFNSTRGWQTGTFSLSVVKPA